MSRTYIILSAIVVILLIGVGFRLASQGQRGIQPVTNQLQEESSLTAEETVAPTATNTPSASSENNSTSPAAITITYNGTSYSPSSVTVKAGTTVTFVNAGSKPFWPASDPHPTHTRYGTFDAKRGVAAGESYSFTFDQTGTWGFHDHLNASAKGTIVVE